MKVWDAGLQPERTLLAWRRTMLAFALAGAVATRFTIESGGVPAASSGVIGVVLALVAYMAVGRRYRTTTRSLADHGELRSGAAPLLLATLSAVAAGIAGLGYVAGRFMAEGWG